MKIKTLLATAFVCVCASMLNAQEKGVYIMGDFNNSWADDYCNKNGKNGTIRSIDDLKDETERWSKTRSYQTENIVCFWEAGFGNDPTQMKRPEGSGTFNLEKIMAECDSIWRFHVNTMGSADPNGKNISQYKFMFMLCYTTNWIAYGGGYDDVIGAMWLCPGAIGVGSAAEYPYGTLAHELFHSMSYQAYADRPDNTYDAFRGSGVSGSAKGPFWERSANNAASTMYPYIQWDWARYAYATQNHYMSTRRHYATSFFLEELRNQFGMDALGLIWRNNLTSEKHPMITANRLFFDSDQAKLNDFIAKTAMKITTFDFPYGTHGWFQKGAQYNTNYASLYNSQNPVDHWSLAFKPRFIPYAVNYENLHFAIRDCQAPQDYGYNIIQLFPQKRNDDGTATVRIHFKGHMENAAKELQKRSGWRWAFVSVSEAGHPRYGEVHAETDGTATYQMQADDAELYLVVTGAPTEHKDSHVYTWEAGFPKYYRYPYEFRLDNAVPLGYNEDYEVPASAELAPHSNGGGLVASTATVAPTAYVGPHAKVLGRATVEGNARIEDFAVVKGSAVVKDEAVVKENAIVFTNAVVSGNAIVSGSARVFNNSKVFGNAFVTDNAFINETSISGNAIACGNLWQRDGAPYTLSGTVIAGGDCESAGNAGDGSEVKGTFLQWPEQGNNGRKRKDGLGNLTTEKIAQLVSSWNDLKTRFSILNATGSASNNDINSAYEYFDSSELAIGDDEADAVDGFEVAVNDLPTDNYLIMNPATGEYLTSTGLSGTPFFAVRDVESKAQEWFIQKNERYGAYRVRDFRGRTIRANGNTEGGSGASTKESFTFEFQHRLDQKLYAVRNVSEDSPYYWAVKNNQFVARGSSTWNGFPIKIQTLEGWNVGVDQVEASAKAELAYMASAAELKVNTPEPAELQVVSLSGNALIQQECVAGENTISLATLSAGTYLVTVKASGFEQSLKLVVR